MYIGIDLGGTNIAAALVSVDGVIVKRSGTPSNAAKGAEAVIAGILQTFGDLQSGGSGAPEAIGLGVPGTVDSEKGEIIFTPNLPLSGVNITGEIRKKYNYPIHLGNDANCAALGETVAGGAKNAKNVVFITLGTGIGGGVVIDGRLYTGASGAGCELGHMGIIAGGRACKCGRRGCWETYASATGLVLTAVECMEKDAGSALWDLCGGNTAKLSGKIIFDAFRAGDSTALQIVETYARHLAEGIINLINIFEPEMVCVGGGISNAWDCLEGLISKVVETDAFYRFLPREQQTRIVKAQLGNDAGIIGAAMLGKR